ncbi:hypothetical protein [Arthrobacter oryzae]|uniref:Uncharacterized protein n=1 Tax=Arthrobacter oryzae TaxID=409290 RepID=A0A3N0BSZ2_9MICC|nr:hypothetical protein [Arthrobacter oryzae]RNL51974.1 hypothetical protein D7003_14645 [Arthrobacter oryzae]
MTEETIYCEMCWTNPGHAHVRDLPLCSQCIEEFKFTVNLEYLDEQPFEAPDGQRTTEAKDSGEFALFNPRNSEQLALARSKTLVGAF